jgi:hypothetical protein
MKKIKRGKGKEETLICKICLEPILNFICINCLEDSAKKWLNIYSPNILNDFEEFSKNLKNLFESSFDEEKCIKCNEKTKTIICPYCYSKEVIDFLTLKDKKLADNFAKFFNFDFLKIGKSSGDILTKNLLPIIIVDEKNNSDINICESCENQSDDLRKVNGNYICEVCRDEDRF